jgi:hypothetical protein
MIPDFTDEGLLPTGIHHATWDEFQARFAFFDRSDQRLRICRQLATLWEEARSSTIVKRLLVAGSVVSNKPEPNDFDCLLVLDASIVGKNLPPIQYKLISRRMARKKFGGDILPALENSAALEEYLQFFQTTRDGNRVGIVEIQL